MDWVTEQLGMLEQKSLELDKQMQEIKFLFKTWPSKNRDAIDDVKTKTTQPSTVDEAGKAQTPAAVMTTEEAESVAMVDKLLKQADRARQVQKKLEEPKKSKSKDVKLASTSTKPDVTRPTSQPNTLQGKQKSDVENSKPMTSVRTRADGKVSGEDIQKKPVTKAAGQSNTKAKVQDPHKTSTSMNPASRKPASSGSSAKSSKSDNMRAGSGRPQSATGQRKVVPVYASAPFQTNSRLTSTKMQTTYRATTNKTVNKAREAHRQSAATSIRRNISNNSTTAAQVNYNNSSISSRTNDIETESISSHVDQGCCENNSSEPDIATAHHNTYQEAIHDCVDKIGDLNVLKIEDTPSDSPSEIGASDRKDTEVKEEQFRLATDGASLKVPGRLKKLVYQNKKLRQRLYTQAVTQKVDSPQQSATDFPLQLELSCSDGTTKQPHLQATQGEYLLNTYISLHSLLDSLHLDNISEESHVADIYRAKTVMEYILTTFQDTGQLLHQAKFDLLHDSQSFMDTSNMTLPTSKYSQGSFVWYNKGFRDKYKEPSTQPVLKYSSYKDLQSYMDAVYRLQWLQLQLDSREHLANTMLPLLQSLDPSTSEFVQALRAGYSLLSQDHSRMNVVIRDTIGDEPPSESISSVEPS